MRSACYLLIVAAVASSIPRSLLGQAEQAAHASTAALVECEGAHPTLASPRVERTSEQMRALAVPVRAPAQLLDTLHVVFTQGLLRQSAFYQDAVLREFFDVSIPVTWRTPVDGDTFGDRVIRPTRIAQTRGAVRTGYEFTLEVGYARRCFSGPPVLAYDSGLVRLSFEDPGQITVADVKRRFGSAPMELVLPTAPDEGRLRYVLPRNPAGGVTRPWVTAEFFPQPMPPETLQSRRAGHQYPDTAVITRIVIRAVEEDPSFPQFITPASR